jgi:AraC-like DNA-binding protein
LELLFLPFRAKDRTHPGEYHSALRHSLGQAIATLLRGGYPDIHLASEIASLSARTLQRRLAEEGLTYSRLVEQTRFNRAVCWLRDPTLKVVEIAAELGYRDAAHFTRAFKRWTGVSPRAFRLSNS